MGIMRRRMRRRVVVAGVAGGAMAYHAGKRHAQNDQAQYDQQQYEQAPPAYQQTEYAPAPPVDTGPDTADLDEIAKLGELHASGVLTDEEFSMAKARLLA